MYICIYRFCVYINNALNQFIYICEYVCGVSDYMMYISAYI